VKGWVADIAARLADGFEVVHRSRMAGLPIVNPRLRVEAAGFRDWGDLALGVLITPWFLSFVLAPRDPARWAALPVGGARTHRFPAGEFEFLVGTLEGFGRYQSCSLFSPVPQFADQVAARGTAHAALDILIGAEPPSSRRAPVTRPPAPPRRLSRRALLLGRGRSKEPLP